MLPHTETGQARRQARDSLFALLVSAVALGAALEVLINLLQEPRPASLLWWVWLGGTVLAGPLLVYWAVVRDDRRIGRAETRIEFLLPYVVGKRRRRVDLGVRRSYAVTTEARAAWAPLLGPGQAAGDGLSRRLRETEGGSFPDQILPEHVALVRHLLVLYLARFGRRAGPRGGIHGWLRLAVPLAEVAWEELPPSVRDNPFSQAIGKARPGGLLLPQGTRVETFERGEVLLRLTWHPQSGGLLRRLLGLGPHRPGGEVVVRWLGPLSAVRRYDKRYEHLTARLQTTGDEVWVLSTRLVVELESHWNALDQVARFRDWGAALALYLQERVDYWTWREYYLERTLDNLDWKIGWVAKGEEPGLAERLRRMDERLARLEAHLWPDEPPQGNGDGAWLSETGRQGDEGTRGRGDEEARR